MSLDKIFKSEPKSINDIFVKDRNLGFYMPAYQRPYSWNHENINNLIDDIESSFDNLLQSDEAIIFLGTLLTVDDDKGESIYRKDEAILPERIKLIVDGQQRITTLILLLTVLHEAMLKGESALQSDIKNVEQDAMKSHFQALHRQIKGLINQTGGYPIESALGEDEYRYLPKVIRSMHGLQEGHELKYDRWGDNNDIGRYQSPLSQYLFRFQSNLLNQSGKFKELDLKQFSGPEMTLIRKNIEFMRKVFKEAPNLVLGVRRNEDDELIEFCELGNKHLQDCIHFNVNRELYDCEALSDKTKNLVNIAAFASFVLHRICVTFVTVNSESYAFDMFEALNTTGEPLTAFETFVPRVIEHLQSKDDLNAECEYKKINSISARFEELSSNEAKNKQTEKIIIAFMRAYNGKIPKTKVPSQREALLSSYNSCNSLAKDKYLEHFKQTVDLIFDTWNKGEIEGLCSDNDTEIFSLCLNYLVDIKHTISLSLLAQFKIKDSMLEDKEDRVQLVNAIKAITAYSVLWRAMSGKADGIESEYKAIHSKITNVDGNEIGPFKLEGANEYGIDLDGLKKYLSNSLSQKIKSKNPKDGEIKAKWIEVCAQSPLLEKKIESNRLLIMAAMHNLDVAGGVYQSSYDFKNEVLNIDTWNELKLEKNSISKIYNPKVAGVTSLGWNVDGSINKDQYIGNVFVDIAGRFKSSDKQSWTALRSSMKVHIEELELVFAEKNVKSLKTSLIAEARFAAKMQDIAYIEEWNEETINFRSEKLLSNAWDNLISWMN
ncbi:DUF262 domain-containing protein [Vibrio tapetis]|uniref:GmrSD restriction endonucleases N-terminal domain-containing protein n=1 Tax=Vibrio tapetis subsp. tapetis TaxID=1671868 RepID=A0A2N8Z9J8_9VIBR|nr:DUF262 domain-containing protein [Vibrio tapetis]SON48533.1 conserved protein of unknown function [Vibrio tapetis subsp. tapetis]